MRSSCRCPKREGPPFSFFLMVLLVSAALVRWVWNGLRPATAARLPRLSYGKAVGVVVLWGLLFSVVLAMISGARELMTPGAWERDGATYKLRPPTTAPTTTSRGRAG